MSKLNLKESVIKITKDINLLAENIKHAQALKENEAMLVDSETVPQFEDSEYYDDYLGYFDDTLECGCCSCCGCSCDDYEDLDYYEELQEEEA